MTPLAHYLIFSAILFSVGVAGVLIRRNILVVFMCLELMLAAANVSLVAFSRAQGVEGGPVYDGQVLALFIMAVAAAEVAVGLALIVAMFRARRSVDSSTLNTLKDL